MAIDFSRFISRFVEEARDHLGRLGEGLENLQREPADAENINALFRSAHTVKGSSRMLKLITISETAHRLEDVLGALREGKIGYTPALGRQLLRGIDALAALVDRVAEGGELPPPDEALCAALGRAAAGENEEEESPPAESGTAGATFAATPAPAQGQATPAAPAAPAAAPATAPADAAPPAQPASAADARLRTPDTVRVRLAKLDELIKLIGEVVSSHARLRERLRDARELAREAAGAPHAARLRRFESELKDDVLVQELLMGELHDKALVMRMLPLAMVFDPAARLVRELARSLGKEAEVEVSGAEIELDRQMIDRLSDPVVHLLRNSVDHGLEPPEARRRQGKSAHGRIHLRARQDGGWVVVEVGDDGAGLNLDAIRDKAVRKGLIGAEQAAALTDAQVTDLIFLPGFSTSPIITELSGRGVGLDVVKRCVVDDLQGVVSVDSRSGAGTRFVLRLPLSLAVMRVLLCAAGGLTFGFTAQYVAELTRVSEAELLTLPERRAVVIRNEFVPVVPLAALLDLPEESAPRPGRGLLLLVVRLHNEKLALVVDELLDERDMVQKPMPEHMRRLPTVSGMVVTGRNELVSILHVPALLERSRSLRERGRSGHDPAAAATDARRVLVVDDSLNTREIERDVLEAHGYQVTLAEDGLDGLHKALGSEFDAVITDVEMPGLDGFSLTLRLRESEQYRHTPIVIITSREKEEDKRRGIEVGADAYIVKGDFEQLSLIDTLANLLG